MPKGGNKGGGGGTKGGGGDKKGKDAGKGGADKKPAAPAKPKVATHCKARHILCEKQGRILEAQAEIQALSTINASAFGSIAEKYSECPSKKKGGDLGWFDRQRMHGDFAAAAFACPIGSYCGPIKTSHGYHLIFVEGRKNGA